MAPAGRTGGHAGSLAVGLAVPGLFPMQGRRRSTDLPKLTMKVWLPTVRAGSGADVFSERLARALTNAGCEVVLTWLPQWVELWPPLARTEPPEKVDIVHANTWSAFAFTGKGLPVVATEHGYVGDPSFTEVKTRKQRAYHALMERYVHASLQRSDQVTAVSSHVAEAIKPFCRRPPVVIPNWVDTDAFFPRSREKHHSFRVLYVGSRGNHKGFEAVQALVRSVLPGIEFWCPRDLEPWLTGAHSDVVFYDRVRPSAMPDLYSQIDAVLFPSYYEGFGYVAAEAMASGRVVVGFNTPSVRWVCGAAALLVPPGSIDALAVALRQLAIDDDLRLRLEQAGRHNVVSRFSGATAAANYMEVYRRLLDHFGAEMDG